MGISLSGLTESSTGDLTISAGSGNDVLIGETGNTVLYVDGGTNYVGVGTASVGNQLLRIGGTHTNTTANGVGMGLFPAITTVTGSTSWSHARFNASVTTYAASNVYTNISTLYLDEPAITLGSGSSATVAATLYIADAPTEATSNYALFVDDGAVRFDDRTLSIGGQDYEWPSSANAGTYLKTDASGNLSWAAATATATGSGTTGKLTKWTNGPEGAIGDSILVESGTDITVTGGVTATSYLKVNDNAHLRLGTGNDSTLYYDGTDTFLNLRAVGTGDLMIALAGSYPSPDPNSIHVWRGSAGSVNSNTDVGLILEDDAATGIQFLVPNGSYSAIYFGDAANNTAGAITYDHNTVRFNFAIEGGNRLLWTASEMAFQQAQTLSTSSGNLTLSAATGADVLIGDNATILYVDGGTDRVGIGTTSADVNLDIEKDGGGGTVAAKISNTGTAANDVAYLELKTAGNAHGTYTAPHVRYTHGGGTHNWYTGLDLTQYEADTFFIGAGTTVGSTYAVAISRQTGRNVPGFRIDPADFTSSGTTSDVGGYTFRTLPHTITWNSNPGANNGASWQINYMGGGTMVNSHSAQTYGSAMGATTLYVIPPSAGSNITFTNASGIHIANQTSAGTTTNLYGIKIDNITGGATDYSIYTGTAQSLFGGNVKINGDIIVGSGSSAAAGNLFSSVATGQLRLSGGSAASSGAHIALYGQSHATAANNAYIDADNLVLRSQNAGSIYLQVDMAGTNAGNVGIGTTTPTALLHTSFSDTGGGVGVQIDNTNADQPGSTLRFYKNSASPAVNDTMGYIEFKGKNSAAEGTLYSYIMGQSTNVTNGAEEGNLEFWNLSAGSNVKALQLLGGNVGIGGTPSVQNMLRVDTGNRTIAVDGDFSMLQVLSSGTVTIPTGDSTYVGTATFGAIAMSGNNQIENAFTLRIANAPTGADNNYALWVDDGVSRFDGSVVIGTAAPAAHTSLHIYDSGSNSSNLLRLENNDASSTAAPYWDFRHNDDGQFVIWRGTSSTFMNFSPAGNVGIGTASPLELLQVEATGGNSNIQLFRQDADGIASGNGLGGIKWGGTQDGGTTSHAIAAGIFAYADGTWSTTTNDSPARLEFWTNPDGGTAASTRMTISSTGNVGIGDTPEVKLHVKGDNSTLRVQDSRATDSSSSYVDLYSGTHAGNTPAIGWSDDTLRFYSGSDRMVITTGGNVGINEPSPDTLLHITAAATTQQSPLAGTLLKLEDTGDTFMQLVGGSTSTVGIYFGHQSNADGRSRGFIRYDNNDAYVEFGIQGVEEAILTHLGGLVLSKGTDRATAYSGIQFGASLDTNLYRSAANTLKTDDYFVATGGLGVGVTPIAASLYVGNTNNFWAEGTLQAETSTSGDAVVMSRNTNTGSAARAILRVHAGSNDNGGDALLQFKTTPDPTNAEWSIGSDQSDAGKLKIGRDWAVGTNTAVIIDTSGSVVIGDGTASHKLEVEGDGNFDSHLSTGGNFIANGYVAAGTITSQGNVEIAVSGGTTDGRLIFSDPGGEGTASDYSDGGSAGVFITLISNSAISYWDMVYVDPGSSYGRLGVADADAASTGPAIGMCLQSGVNSVGSAVQVLTCGIVRNNSWSWTPGGTLYLSTTAGGITQTKPSGTNDQIQIVGIALSDDTAYIKPDLYAETVA